MGIHSPNTFLHSLYAPKRVDMWPLASEESILLLNTGYLEENSQRIRVSLGLIRSKTHLAKMELFGSQGAMKQLFVHLAFLFLRVERYYNS